MTVFILAMKNKLFLGQGFQQALEKNWFWSCVIGFQTNFKLVVFSLLIGKLQIVFWAGQLGHNVLAEREKKIEKNLIKYFLAHYQWWHRVMMSLYNFIILQADSFKRGKKKLTLLFLTTDFFIALALMLFEEAHFIGRPEVALSTHDKGC